MKRKNNDTIKTLRLSNFLLRQISKVLPYKYIIHYVHIYYILILYKNILKSWNFINDDKFIFIHIGLCIKDNKPKYKAPIPIFQFGLE